ncbi:DUF342 domain-containing protein [Bacillus solitudinis]|uniref:DUF342 domain-containing protein n=1 Tax=Bacillus solitudinis TaxID=2014074 RepID=UPI000C231E59|nr:FapA family protein [Bacillus solitudinis]
MVELEQFFTIQISTDKRQATLVQNEKIPEEEWLEEKALLQFIKEHGVVYGLNETNITNFVTHRQNLTDPLVIANGKPPVNGQNAFLKAVQFDKKTSNSMGADDVNLKDVINIPSVLEGDKIGEKVAATKGENGLNVLGEEIVAKTGKDFKLRAGKNTRLKEQTIYSLISGQVSVENKLINVFPIYEVRGDLDLKTGNITFVGNVTVHGNVPTGFEIKADGDIRVTGTVEGALLEAGGSIFVGAGIVGQNKSIIKAKQNLQTTFINEGHVEVGGTIEVVQAILHSTCSAEKAIVCTRGKGNIVGGSLSANEFIHAKAIGNDMQTKTTLYIGLHESVVLKERELQTELAKSQEEFSKLGQLLKVYLNKEKQLGELQGKEKLLKLRVLHSFKETKDTIEIISEQLEEIKELMIDTDGGYIQVDNNLFPNVDVHFGKYRRKVLAKHQKTKITITDSEITISTL